MNKSFSFSLFLFFVLLFCNLSFGLRFFVIGDWGDWTNNTVHQPQIDVANTMASKAQSNGGLDFIISTGDNFYELGVTDANSPRFDVSWAQVYTQPAIAQKPWYVVAGNHDHYGNAQAQVDYAARNSRWIFPSLHYTEQFTVSDDTTLQIVFIDTVLLTEADNATKQAELLWVKNTLKRSRADWVFVVGHYQVYSIERGRFPYMIDNLVPLMQRYGVAAYISGHEHNLQHLAPDGDETTEYFISGSGARCMPIAVTANETQAMGSKFFYPRTGCTATTSGFMAVSVNDDTMSVKMITQLGQTVYSYTKDKITRRRRRRGSKN